MNKLKRKGIFSVFGAFLFNIILGSYQIWPKLLKYFNLFIENKNKDLKLNSNSKIIFIPLFRLLYSIFIPVGILLMRKIKLKKCILLSFFLLITSYILILFTSSKTIILISFIIFAFSIGISYITLTINSCLFFPVYRGLIFGFIFSGNALGNYFFENLGEKLINPYKANIEKSGFYNSLIIKNFIFFIKILICLFTIIGSISIILITPWKKSMMNGNYFKKNEKIPLSELEFIDERTDNNFDVFEINRNKSIPYNGFNKNEKIKDTLNSKPFLQLMFMFCLSTLFSYLKINDFPEFKNEEFKEYIFFLFNVTDIFFRILWGALLDIYDFKTLYLISLYIQIGIFSTFYFISDIKYFCITYSFLEGVTFSSTYVIQAFSFYKIFGVNNGGILYGFSKIFCNFTQLIIYIFINYLNTESIYFLILCLFYSICTMLSSIILCFIEVKKFDYEKFTNEKIKKRRFSTSSINSNEGNF